MNKCDPSIVRKYVNSSPTALDASFRVSVNTIHWPRVRRVNLPDLVKA